MNCKAGDLAVVIKGKDPQQIGKIVRCMRSTVDRFTGDPGWIVEPTLGKWRGVKDANLRPLHDSGDDAQDETLSWVPVPTTEGVPA